MNNAADHKKPAGLAVLLGGAWLLALGIIFLITMGMEETWGLGLFLGRFHILIVHIPIGLLCFAGILEVLGVTKWFPGCKQAVLPTLWIGMLGALLATFLGFTYMRSEDIAGNSMTWHLWTGLAVALGSVLALIFKLLQVRFVYEGTLAATVVLVGVSSHYGGNMVHGSDYLTEHAPEGLKPMLAFMGGHSEIAVEPAPAANVNDLIIYEHILQPIFNAKCVECHGPEKVKGELRMDSYAELAKGGDLGEEFIPGDAEGSELMFRVTLPPDDDEFMPPSEGEPMTPAEIRVMAWWIDTGASPTMTVGQAKPDGEIMQILESLVQGVAAVDSTAEPAAMEPAPPTEALSSWDELDEVAQLERVNQLKEQAESVGYRVSTLGPVDDRLDIDVSPVAGKFGDKHLADLIPVRDHIARLNLANSKVTDKGMEQIGGMTNLEWLHLGGTRITDSGLSKLSGLSNLNYINLYQSQVSNQGLQHLATMSDLRNLYLWQTDAALNPEHSNPTPKNSGVEVAQSGAKKPANP